jgi:hypothetical protein
MSDKTEVCSASFLYPAANPEFHLFFLTFHIHFGIINMCNNGVENRREFFSGKSRRLQDMALIIVGQKTS